MSPRLQTLSFSRRHRPLWASIRTADGIVRVKWMDVDGDWCWFSSGPPDGKKAAVALIERIERMVNDLHD